MGNDGQPSKGLVENAEGESRDLEGKKSDRKVIDVRKCVTTNPGTNSKMGSDGQTSRRHVKNIEGESRDLQGKKSDSELGDVCKPVATNPGSNRNKRWKRGNRGRGGKQHVYKVKGDSSGTKEIKDAESTTGTIAVNEKHGPVSSCVDDSANLDDNQVGTVITKDQEIGPTNGSAGDTATPEDNHQGCAIRTEDKGSEPVDATEETRWRDAASGDARGKSSKSATEIKVENRHTSVDCALSVERCVVQEGTINTSSGRPPILVKCSLTIAEDGTVGEKGSSESQSAKVRSNTKAFDEISVALASEQLPCNEDKCLSRKPFLPNQLEAQCLNSEEGQPLAKELRSVLLRRASTGGAHLFSRYPSGKEASPSPCKNIAVKGYNAFCSSAFGPARLVNNMIRHMCNVPVIPLNQMNKLDWLEFEGEKLRALTGFVENLTLEILKKGPTHVALSSTPTLEYPTCFKVAKGTNVVIGNDSIRPRCSLHMRGFGSGRRISECFRILSGTPSDKLFDANPDSLDIEGDRWEYLYLNLERFRLRNQAH